MPDQKINDFVDSLYQVFGDSEYPGDDNIVYLETLTMNDDDASEMLNAFKGNRWQQVDTDALIANRNNLPLFTAAGFAYYLPAYMRAIALHPDEVGVLGDNLLYSLTPPETGDRWEATFNQMVEKFTPLESNVIREFLSVYTHLNPDALVHDPSGHVYRAIEFWA